MKVTKFLKGLLAAALAVTMAVTPATSVKAAEVTVTSGASTYTFSEMPVAAFEVTGWANRPIILYVLPEGTTVHSQAGSSDWEGTIYADEACFAEPTLYEVFYMEDGIGETLFENDGSIDGEVSRSKDNIPYIRFTAIYHSDISGFNSIYATENRSSFSDGSYDLTAIPEVFALNGATAVQIPVETALAMDNANVQSSTTQTAAAQAAAQAQAAADAQADAQAAQAADAQADAQAAQAAAQAQAAQTQIAPQQTSVAQGTYTVEANDNLCKIAQKVYGDMKAWREIYKANSNVIKNDYIIHKGQILTIPAR